MIGRINICEIIIINVNKLNGWMNEKVRQLMLGGRKLNDGE